MIGEAEHLNYKSVISKRPSTGKNDHDVKTQQHKVDNILNIADLYIASKYALQITFRDQAPQK